MAAIVEDKKNMGAVLRVGMSGRLAAYIFGRMNEKGLSDDAQVSRIENIGGLPWWRSG